MNRFCRDGPRGHLQPPSSAVWVGWGGVRSGVEVGGGFVLKGYLVPAVFSVLRPGQWGLDRAWPTRLRPGALAVAGRVQRKSQRPSLPNAKSMRELDIDTHGCRIAPGVIIDNVSSNVVKAESFARCIEKLCAGIVDLVDS